MWKVRISLAGGHPWLTYIRHPHSRQAKRRRDRRAGARQSQDNAEEDIHDLFGDGKRQMR
jgi:hypothetical protein